MSVEAARVLLSLCCFPGSGRGSGICEAPTGLQKHTWGLEAGPVSGQCTQCQPCFLPPWLRIMNLTLGFMYESPFPLLFSAPEPCPAASKSRTIHRRADPGAAILELFTVRAEWSGKLTWKPGPLVSESSPFQLSPLYWGQSPNARGLSFPFCEVRQVLVAAAGGLDGDRRPPSTSFTAMGRTQAFGLRRLSLLFPGDLCTQ